MGMISPSSQSSPSHAARGVVRDALTGLQNLYGLLRSPKVGPKALVGLLPEIRTTCEPLELSFVSMAKDVRPTFGGSVDPLLEFTQNLSRELVTIVGRFEGVSLDAKSRLALEAEIFRLAPRLDSLRHAWELAVDVACEPTVELEMGALVNEAVETSVYGGFFWTPLIQVQTELPTQPIHVQARARTVVPMLLMGLGLMGADLQKQPSLKVETEEKKVIITVSKQGTLQKPVLLSFRLMPVIPEIIEFVQDCIKHNHGTLTISETQAAIVLG
jgi:hypothetical protein